MEVIDIIGMRDETLPALFVQKSIGSRASLLLLFGDAMLRGRPLMRGHRSRAKHRQARICQSSGSDFALEAPRGRSHEGDDVQASLEAR